MRRPPTAGRRAGGLPADGLERLTEAVTLLRTQALAILERAAGLSIGGDVIWPTVEHLQRVGNELGSAEAELRTELGPSPAQVESPEPDECSCPALSRAAAETLAMAEAIVPLAPVREEEAERWLRLLRANGRVGETLAAAGVPTRPALPVADQPPPPSRREGRERVHEVSRRARRLAALHRAETVDTLHLLFALLDVYGTSFDRALYTHGVSRDGVLAELPGKHSLSA